MHMIDIERHLHTRQISFINGDPHPDIVPLAELAHDSQFYPHY